MAAIFDYEGRSFNYSASLNQGIAIARSAYLLVISSHTSLPHPGAMAYALDLLERDATLGGAYFAFEAAGTLGAARIDRGNFSGFNGMFNTCGLYRTALVRQRPFRPEVFAAEDQEWSRWLLRETGMSIAKIAGSGVRYDNPAGYTAAKRWKEWTAVALYARPEMRRLLQIARVAYRGLRPYPPQSAAERAFNLRLAGFLLRHVDLTGLW